MNKLSLYQITEEMEALDSLYWENIDEETGEIKNAEVLEEFEKEIKNLLASKGAQIIASQRQSKLFIEAAKSEIERLTKLKKSLERKEEFYKNYIIRSMEKANLIEIKTEIGKIKLTSGKGKVEIYDLGLLDDKFFKIKKEPMKTEIREALKAGLEVQGAKMIYENGLSIK